jgi:hypothetical protein
MHLVLNLFFSFEILNRLGDSANDIFQDGLNENAHEIVIFKEFKCLPEETPNELFGVADVHEDLHVHKHPGDFIHRQSVLDHGIFGVFGHALMDELVPP